MKRLLAASFVAITTMSSLLIAVPANAAPALVIKSRHIAMNSAGLGSVQVECRAKKTCTGSVWATNHSASATKFAVKSGATAYIKMKLTGWQSLPVDSRGYRTVTLNAHGTTAVSATLEPWKAATIRGSVQRLGGPAISDIEVQLWRVGARDRMVSTHRTSVAEGGNFSFTVPVGINNGPSASYRIQIIGKQAGNRRTWWWQGSNGNATGGTPHSAQATRFTVTRNASQQFDYVTNFRYSSISGHITPVGAGKEVTVFQRPAVWPATAAGMRNLDVTSCADVVGRVKTNSTGDYNMGFVPVNANRQYIVKTETSSWNGTKGTCHAAVNYRNAADGVSTPGLLSVPAGGTVKNFSEARTGTAVSIGVSGYQGTSATANMDKWITIREVSPGRSTLNSDIVYQGMARSHVLPEGRYWVETGRRQGCSAWYSSRFKDNSGYFNGEDRGAEKWKAQNFRMYRDHCRSYSTGAYKMLSVTGTGSQAIYLSNQQGGTVKGKITGRTKKLRGEVMVRLTSTNGNTVYRTALSDGSGNFRVTGLAPGSYTVNVNSDSWRGKRGFSGKKRVTVKAGKVHSVGKLNFKG